MNADALLSRLGAGVWRCLAPGSLVLGLLAAGCAEPLQSHRASSGKEYFSTQKYGAASPRVVVSGDIPRGGGAYLVGRPYTIAGRTYYPAENPNYTAEGTASWYGDAFNGRKTANGEIYDMNAISAAHPTMPLPSYARVTNVANGYSIIVRVNDRGPYHGGRVMDVSSRVADALNFKNAGTGHVKIEYIGRAPIEGSSDRQLYASLRTDGGAASIDGAPAGPTLFASAAPAPAPPPQQVASAEIIAPARPPRVAPEASRLASAEPAPPETLSAPRNSKPMPLPPLRPYDLGTIPDAGRPIASALSPIAVTPPPRPLQALADPSSLY